MIRHGVLLSDCLSDNRIPEFVPSASTGPT